MQCARRDVVMVVEVGRSRWSFRVCEMGAHVELLHDGGAIGLELPYYYFGSCWQLCLHVALTRICEIWCVGGLEGRRDYRLFVVGFGLGLGVLRRWSECEGTDALQWQHSPRRVICAATHVHCRVIFSGNHGNLSW